MQRFCQLLLIFGIGQAVFAAPFFEFPDLTRRIPERSSTPGCAYRGDRYNHGDQVPTLEPCLNCTCIRAVVVCYLRVCPSAPTPPPGCFLAREVGQCCPTLVCGGSGGIDKKSDSDESTNAPELRPTFQPEPSPKTTTAAPEENSLVFVSSTEPYEDTAFFNDIPGGCLVNGTLYGDGSAMLSSSFCEYCFCIRGKTTCLKPKCDLFIEGCKALYDSNFSCCPSRYECYKKTTILETTITTESFPVAFTTTTYETTVYDDFADCVEDDEVYHQGEEVQHYRSCHSCYCNNATITCEKMKCSPPIAGCQPIIPEGHCCPVSYKCDYLDGTINYNTKGANLNASNLEIETKKGNIKGVKQSDIFKDIPDSNIDENQMIQPISKDLTSFFDNFVPLHRRLDEDIAELYLSPKENIDLSQFIPENLTNVTFDVKKDFSRENDKTMDLDSQEQTTPFYLENNAVNSKDQTITSTEPTKNGNITSPAVLVGTPEEKVIGIRDILTDYFANKDTNSSIFVTKQDFEPKRNNSKHASSIGDYLESIATPSFYNTQEVSPSDKTTTTYDVTETDGHSSTPVHLENGTGFSSTITLTNIPTTDDKPNNLFIHTTLNFEEDEDITLPKDGSIPYIIRGTKNNRTYSTPPQVVTHPSVDKETEKYTDINIFLRISTTKSEPITTDNPTSYITTVTENKNTYSIPPTDAFVTQQSTDLDITITSSPENDQIDIQNSSEDVKVADLHTTYSLPPPTGSSNENVNPKITLEDIYFSSSATTTEDEPITTKTTKAPSRINSKLPLSSQKDKLKDIVVHANEYDALLDLYLPALSRAGDDIPDDEDDFTNVGSIHLGAPLSVAATETRRDPANLRNKITESGGVIFMDPKYTDIRPDVPTTQNQPKPTVRNPIKDTYSGGFTGYSVPIDRADVDYTRHDLKKGPRIQDVYNQTNAGQDFKIIPFVAEDAIRGLHGKVNGTFHLIPIATTEGPPDIVSDFCFIRGRIYKNGEMIVKQDPCELCRCFYGQELCQLQRCPTPPPDCTPEKLPNFCCPRYTCEKLPAGQVKFINRVSPMILALSTQATPKSETTRNPQTLSTSTNKPEIVRTPENPPKEIPRTTNSHFTGITRSSTNRMPTTKQPDTTKSSHFLDPWGLLQVSGCNIYGKFFKINDQVEILSGPCSHCICTVNGVECNDIC